MGSEHEHEQEHEQGTASLAGVIGLSLISMGLALAMLSANQGQVAHSRQSRELAVARYAALAGASDALSEIRQGVDGVGDRAGGLGALGLANPIVYNDANGNQVAEYRTFVANKAADIVADPPLYYVRVMAAVPSFAAVAANQRGSQGFGMEYRLQSAVSFSLAPNLGAISISGPVDTWHGDIFNSWDNPDFVINGGGYPAVVLTDEDAYDDFVEIIDGEWDSGWNLEARMTGTPDSVHNAGETGPSGEFTAPVQLQEETGLSAAVLNEYRDALRTYAEGLAHVTGNASGNKDTAWTGAVNGVLPDGTILLHDIPTVKNAAGAGQPRINADHTFGAVGAEATVVVDTSKFYQGGSKLSDNFSRTITGAGTLVILHPIGSFSDNANGKQFNLNWTGDVIVVGYPDDTTSGHGENASTDNLLYLSRADWDVTGNLILLSSGSTEASLELRGSGPTDTANLNVKGSLLLFAEATGAETEIDIESHAHVKVEGIVGLYGKKAELENQSQAGNTSLTIEGTLALGFPTGPTTINELQFTSDTDLTFDLGNVTDATDSLAALQQELVFATEIPAGYSYGAQSWLLENQTLFDSHVTDFATAVGNGDDMFVDTNLMQTNRP